MSTKQQKTLPRGIAIKAKTPKRERTLEEQLQEILDIQKLDDDYSYPDDPPASEDESFVSCGIKEVFELGESVPAKVQAAFLWRVMGKPSFKKTSPAFQVILSDVLDEERGAWAETKALAYKGPITVNPNTKNQVRLYIITQDELKQLFEC